MSSAILHIVATPIGNMEDITLRALKVLASVDLIAAEDTRHTRALLSHHGIDTALMALHEHNEEKAAQTILARLQEGQNVALVSDAGTPLLSDPGYRLVKLAAANAITVVAIPGPSAITAALSISGLATDRFAFEGFVPQKPAARLTWLKALCEEPRSLVLFESSHRIEASLLDMMTAFGEDRPAVICREMTKQFETVLRGTLAELHRAVSTDPNQRKGEFVVIVAGAERDQSADLIRAIQLGRALQPYLTTSQAARVAARIHPVSRREVYDQLQQDATEPDS